MKAVILAAGEGQRLRPFTANKPKVMIKVGNKPILEYVVDALKEAGIREIVMVVGYKKERVIDYFGNGEKFGVKIEYVTQKQQLGTAHALKQAKDLVEGKFLVLPGDNIIDSETLKDVLSYDTFSVVYKVVEEPTKYGVLEVENGKVKRIIEKPEEEVSYLASTGIYLLDDRIFEFIGDERDLTNVVNVMIESGIDFFTVESKGLWLDIVYPWDILKVNDLALKHKGKSIAGKVESGVTIVGDVVIGEGSIIRSGSFIKGPVIIGVNSEIGANSVILPSTSIGDNTKVEEFCRIENCVIGENVVIGADSYVRDSVIDSGTIFEPKIVTISESAEVKVDGELRKVKSGAFVGEGCKIGAGSVLRGGAVIGNRCEIAPLKVICGKIDDVAKVL
ncbi:Nucleotidyl transferase [Ferroglobus placidus DSM 10642]|uniref:Bifunctional protein GlmU n=1 Tax=Ferroglobus placidus (strain DSM 10642 / AEDII12DO) TaxID=589924 RepID=D3S1M6_FERPA|nr:bifunctional sugar-1-phosphate nucleotidylyltransferase/acetyltransferase [Ferroglobus placidus]ADC66490.1 Nucleotidyl transferase [Ferroglobus placidus DSM 10642]